MEERERERERSEHWCSVTVGTKEDKVNGSHDRCGQVGRVFIPLSSNGQTEGSTAALVKPAKIEQREHN
jgi:hypothetical protein